MLPAFRVSVQMRMKDWWRAPLWTLKVRYPVDGKERGVTFVVEDAAFTAEFAEQAYGLFFLGARE